MEVVYLQLPLPKITRVSDFEQIFFYTKKGSKYFWGDGNTSFSEKKMSEWQTKGEIAKLKTPITLDRDHSLFIGIHGIYIGTHTGSKIRILDKPKKLLKK